jgi:hypothetical protein
MAHVRNTKKTENYGFQEGAAFMGAMEQIQAS